MHLRNIFTKPLSWRLKLTLAGLFLFILTLGTSAFLVWYLVDTAFDSATNTTTIFTIESGENLRTIATHLEEQKLIRWAEAFRLLGRYEQVPLQAGEFELNASMSPRKILETLAYGQPILHRLHFAEGLTMTEIAQAVEATGLTTAERFLEACQNQEFLTANNILAPNAEGYLFPRIPNQNPYPILQAILDQFKATVRDLPQVNDPQALHELVILATLVEKETGIGTERARVAGVYSKRLQLGMLLQCDPTIIYGLGENFTGRLRRVHLQDETNPYNTYVHPGLPPGPICSPGKAALLAAAYPEEHEFLYFVARPDGSHHFSRTLREHNNAVIKYQRGGRPLPQSRSTTNPRQTTPGT